MLRIFIVLAVIGTLILAITNTLAGQKLVSDISIYIMTLYVITAIVRLSPIYYMIIFSMSFIYFVLGMQIMQPDVRFIKWSFMNAIRYGGDELVILFPGATLPDACNVCQSILDSMSQVEVSEHILTGSIGVAELTESNYHNFIEYADAKMYEAKNSGKNRIIS